VPGSLALALVGVVALAGLEGAHVVGRDDLRTAMRVLLLVVIAAQLGLVVLALRRSSAGAMGLLLCAATALVASLAGGLGAGAAVLALAVLVLLAWSLRWFPSYEL
jgi:hypothetical protein